MLTLDSGITVRIEGYVNLSGYNDANRLINKGRIVVDAAGQSASLSDLENRGTIEVVNGTLNLGTTSSKQQLGNVKRTGGIFNLGGTLDLGGQTLRLDASTGSWNLTGTLKGGTLELADGATLNVQGGTFDGVTLASDLTVANSSLTLKNGLTLANGARLTLNESDGQWPPTNLYYADTQTVGGTGSLVFASIGGYPSSLSANGQGVLTLDSGITVRIEGYVNLSGYNDANRLINKGRIVVDASGQASLINLDNQGTVEVIDGTLTIQTVTVATNSSIRAMGGSLWFDGSYTRASIEATVSLLGGRVTYL